MRAVLLASAIAATFSFAAPAAAGPVFQENFDGVGIGNYGTGNHVGNFTVTGSTVDIFGRPEYAYACPAPNAADGNHCLDLNGSDNGQITSDAIALTAGQTYTVSFNMAGNGTPYAPGETSPYTFDVTFAGVAHSYAIAPLAVFMPVSFSVTPLSGGSTNLVFTSTSPNQPTFWGAILDDIMITAPTASALPEPASWAMMIGGFGLVGGAMRRRPACRAVVA